MDVSLSGFRSIAEFVNAVLLLPMRFWSQWTMDRLIERTVHRGMVGTVAGTSIGKAIFTNLDFADDVALLVEMLSVLILALEVMDEEAQPLGLTINRAKTKIQTTVVTVPLGTTVVTVQVGRSNRRTGGCRYL